MPQVRDIIALPSKNATFALIDTKQYPLKPLDLHIQYHHLVIN